MAAKASQEDGGPAKGRRGATPQAVASSAKGRSAQPKQSAQSTQSAQADTTILHDPQVLLESMLSRSVIPNLIQRARREAPMPEDAERDLLMRLVLRGERDGAMALVRQCVTAGMSAGAICEGLLAPVANSLGRAWEQDSCDFVAVTFGVSLLTDLLGELRELDPPRPARRRDQDGFPPSILLAGMPGEHHGFGLKIVADAFQRSGWEVSMADNQSAGAVLAQAAAQAHDAIGLSVATDRCLTAMGPLISALRRLSRNGDVRIVVGGPAILRHPDTGTRLGADVVAIDAQSAVAMTTTALGNTVS